jgi:hypothetical protein
MSGEDDRTVANGYHAGDWRVLGGPANCLDRALQIVEAYGDRVVLPRIVEHVAAVSRKEQLDAELGGRVVESAKLIARRVRKKKNPHH